MLDRIRELFGGKRSTGADSAAVIGGAAVAGTLHDHDRADDADSQSDPGTASGGGGWGDSGGAGGDAGSTGT